MSPDDKAAIEAVIVEALRPVLTDIGKELSAISVGIGALLAQGAKHGEAIDKLSAAVTETTRVVELEKGAMQKLTDETSGLKTAVHDYQHAVSDAYDRVGARVQSLEEWRKSQSNGGEHGTHLVEVGE